MVERSLSMREVAGSMPAFSRWRRAFLRSLPCWDSLRFYGTMGHSLDELLRLAAAEKVFRTGSCSHSWQKQVPPRFELGSLDSESRVLTITPWNLCHNRLCAPSRRE
ncbi:hypothetical protein ABG768_021562 [Culter alburnus]|uniref:Uncharacterized protein n=1 Tax=Culter alburnus TaxID=194366 RepID=A0AAW2AUG9_CULAL